MCVRMKRMMRRREFLLSSARYLGAGAVTLTALPGWNRSIAAESESLPASAFALNLIGSLPTLPKLASVNVRATSFVVRSTLHNNVAYRGALTSPAHDAA